MEFASILNGFQIYRTLVIHSVSFVVTLHCLQTGTRSLYHGGLLLMWPKGNGLAVGTNIKFFNYYVFFCYTNQLFFSRTLSTP